MFWDFSLHSAASTLKKHKSHLGQYEHTAAGHSIQSALEWWSLDW